MTETCAGRSGRRWAPRLLTAGATAALAAAVVGGVVLVEPPGGAEQSAAIAAAVTTGLPSPRLTVLGTLPHDTGAWTEGLEITDGTLYEGTGEAGRSELRELDASTGQLRRATPLPNQLYGEGITVVGSTIWQLTWRDGVALGWDRATLRPERRVSWDGEGWGLCRAGDGQLIASDGTDRLRVLDPSTLAVRGSVPVRLRGEPLTGLNELECVAGGVWANVFDTDWLVRIELQPAPHPPPAAADAHAPGAGTVTAAVNAADLQPDEHQGHVDVLNGIAAIPGTDQFLLTGKYWPSIFRVRFGT